MRSRVVVFTFLILISGTAYAGVPDPCDYGACCVNPNTCVVTDRQTIDSLTLNRVASCPVTMGSYCTGGNGGTGYVPFPGPCGFGWAPLVLTPSVALANTDHLWLQSSTTPKVVDFINPVNSVIVYPAVDHGPFPEEALEYTVWGSYSCDISNFPSGWTLATMTSIYAKGWEDPALCQGQDNADDYAAQYSFPGSGFRYIATHADFSISIFDDPSHTTFRTGDDSAPGTPGWQSFDDEIDAVGSPNCDTNVVEAEIEINHKEVGFVTAPVGDNLCFDGSDSFALGGIATIGWDLDGNSSLDVLGDEACIFCDDIKSGSVTLYVVDYCGCVDTATVYFECNDPCNRVSISQKGSLLIYPKVELKWNAAGVLIQDTFLTIVNDFYEGVHVQWYFINGDEPTAAVSSGSPPVLIERAHRGWNWVDCPMYLTGDDTGWLSMATGRGGPLDPTCSPFTITDPGTPRGRPDPDGPAGTRVLRGYAIAYAVDNQGRSVDWNHLSGGADIVNYNIPEAWEYNAYAFQTVHLNNSEPGQTAGSNTETLDLNGSEYDWAFDKLLLDFFATGSQAFSNGGAIATIDTDLTLFPVDVNLRQDSDGPVTTKAHFDIWNENEDGRSGTTRCITCWDQALVSTYEDDNHFLIANLQTNKGKARIDGMASDVCDDQCDWRWECEEESGVPFQVCGWEWHCEIRSKDAALLGVHMKLIAFSGTTGGRALAGSSLVGQGVEAAKIRVDLVDPPDDLLNPGEVGGAIDTGGNLQRLDAEGAKDSVRSTRDR